MSDSPRSPDAPDSEPPAVPGEAGHAPSAADDVAARRGPDDPRPSEPGHGRSGRRRFAGTRWRSPDEPCPNCGDPTPGRFCPVCGQRKTVVQVSVGTIVGEVLKDELALNSALPRTIVAILFRPGYLTNEYIRGRVVRYIPPLRLYLITSILFFLVLSFLSLRALEQVNVRATLTPEAAAGADPDSVLQQLQRRREELQALDTAALPAVARGAIRQMLSETEAALRRQQLAGPRPEPPGAGPAAGQPADTVVAAPGQPGDTAAAPPARRVTPGEVALAPGTLQPWAADVQQGVGRSPSWVRRPVERKLAQLGHLPVREAVRAFVRDMLEYAPHMMFVLLPVFAFLLKLLYIRRERYYAEHFVFALHTHAFFFLMFLILLAVPWPGVRSALLLWLAVYVWLALKRVYRQGWFRTTVKWWVLGWTYSLLLVFGILGLVLSMFVLG